MRQGAVGLTDGHSDIVTTAIATGYDDRLPVTGMKSVTDNRLAQLIVSIMKLSRRHPGLSSTAGILVIPDDGQQAAMQDAELLAKRPSNNEQRLDQRPGQVSSRLAL